jgi:hypothetical protein
VQRSSPSIGSLAAALAKAQSELINPEKSLAATIRSEGVGGGAEQTFRYAPLSSGLDIAAARTMASDRSITHRRRRLNEQSKVAPKPTTPEAHGGATAANGSTSEA